MYALPKCSSSTVPHARSKDCITCTLRAIARDIITVVISARGRGVAAHGARIPSRRRTELPTRLLMHQLAARWLVATQRLVRWFEWRWRRERWRWGRRKVWKCTFVVGHVTLPRARAASIFCDTPCREALARRGKPLAVIISARLVSLVVVHERELARASL